MLPYTDSLKIKPSSSPCFDPLTTASLAFREPKHVLRVMSGVCLVSAIGNADYILGGSPLSRPFLSSPRAFVYLSLRSVNRFLGIRRIETLLPLARLLLQSMHTRPGILTIYSRHLWQFWRLHCSSLLHSMYSGSEFTLKN